jgi:hypothetical protein
MDARWVASYDRWGAVSPYEIFRGWTDECRQLFPHYPQNLRVAAYGDDLRSFPWLPKTLKKPGLDGRFAVAIIDATQFWGTCVTLHRSIENVAGQWFLKASFSDLVLHRSRKRVDLSTLPDMVSAVSLILAVDAERILRRAIEHDQHPGVIIQISSGDLPDDMKNYFVAEIAESLNGRAVAIEPPGTLHPLLLK